MTARVQKISKQRVFVPIIPLNSRATSLKEKEDNLTEMLAKNPLLGNLMKSFDFQVQ